MTSEMIKEGMVYVYVKSRSRVDLSKFGEMFHLPETLL